MLRILTLVLTLVIISGFAVGQDLFTSIAKLTPLVKTEKELLKYATEYVEKEEQKVELIKK